MRWLMVVLLVSLLALLIAAAGVARHIVLQRKRVQTSPETNPGEMHVPALDTAEETDLEP